MEEFNFNKIEGLFVLLMKVFFQKTIKNINSRELAAMDLNELLYMFKDFFADIRKNMNWELNERVTSRSNIIRHRAALIVDSRNIIHHQLPGDIISAEMKISVVVNMLLFIQSLKSRFDDEESRDIYDKCEQHLKSLLNYSDRKSNAEDKDPQIEKIEKEIETVKEGFAQILNATKQTNQMMNDMLRKEKGEYSGKEIEGSSIKEQAADEDDLDWFNKIDAATWFRYSRIAKEKGLFSGRARAFLYNMGVSKANERRLNEKQFSWAKILYAKMEEHDPDRNIKKNKVIEIRLPPEEPKKPEEPKNKPDFDFSDDIPF